MKRTLILLVMMLALSCLLTGTTTATATPPWDPDPADGTGEGDDGDHPWGGDRVIGTGSGSITTRTVYTTALTGNTALDLFIFNVLNAAFYPKPTNQDQYEILNSRTYTGNRYRLTREVAR
jgi:hypothetical protein